MSAKDNATSNLMVQLSPVRVVLPESCQIPALVVERYRTSRRLPSVTAMLERGVVQDASIGEHIIHAGISGPRGVCTAVERLDVLLSV